MPLILIANIIVSDDLRGVDRRPTDLIQPLIPELQTLADECMSVEGLKTADFLYCLEAACAFAGHIFWGRELDYLVDGAFPGQCPACGQDLHVVIGKYGFFVTAQEWARPENSGVTRNPILSADLQDLPGIGAWLHSRAVSHRQSEAALWIRHIFGTGSCPACHQTFKVDDAITLGLPPRNPAEHGRFSAQP